MNSILANPQTQPKRQLVVTKTGEPYQPVRVYFQISNPKTVQGLLKKLRCVRWDEFHEAWVWVYEDEARKLRFQISHNALDKKDRPLILAELTFPSSTEMVLDTRSVDRALYAIEFFSRRMNWRVAEANRLRIVNRFFPPSEVPQQPLNKYFGTYFDRPDVKVPNPMELLEKLQKIEEQDLEGDAREIALNEFLEQEAKQPIPQVEELGVDVREIGLGPLSMTLKMREIEAYERWQGNTSINQFEIMQRLMEMSQLDGQAYVDEDGNLVNRSEIAEGEASGGEASEGD